MAPLIRAALSGLLPLLVAGCATTSTLRPRGLSDASTTASALQQALAPRRVAVLVGIDTYLDPTFPDLLHAGHDATALGEALRQADAGFDDVLVVTDAQGVTRERVFAALRRATAGLREDDELVVFFAGHGTRVMVGDTPHRFLLPADARASEVVASGIDLEALLDFVLTLPPLRKGVIIDACFDGGGRSVAYPGARGEGSLPMPTRDLRIAHLGPGDAQVFATTPGRPSLEDDTLGHGVYTWYLLESLGWGRHEADRNGDGLLTLWEAHDHARGKVIAHTEGVQIPEAVLRTVGEADVVLAGKGDERHRRNEALLYLYGVPDEGLQGASVQVDGRTRGILPGTLTIAPGRRQITVVAADGTRLADGYAEIGRGRAYRADELIARVEGDRGAVTTRAVAVVAPALAPAIGDASGALEVAVDGRVGRGKARGVVVGGRALLGLSPGGQEDLGVRTLGALGVDAGWRGDAGPLRWRAAWGVSTWWIPPRGEDFGQRFPLAVPDRAGRVFVATGPRFDVGVDLGRRWALTLQVGVEGTSLPLTRTGDAVFVPVVLAGLGVAAGF